MKYCENAITTLKILSRTIRQPFVLQPSLQAASQLSRAPAPAMVSLMPSTLARFWGAHALAWGAASGLAALSPRVLAVLARGAPSWAAAVCAAVASANLDIRTICVGMFPCFDMGPQNAAINRKISHLNDIIKGIGYQYIDNMTNTRGRAQHIFSSKLFHLYQTGRLASLFYLHRLGHSS